MSGDYSRFTDRPQRRYTGVRMQQGRVQLDADWNEEVAILKRRWETQAEDTFGPCAVPKETTPDGFKVTPSGTDLQLGAGRIYIHGRLAEIFPNEKVGNDPVSYLHQPFYPQPPALPGGPYVVYLDVWDREVTYIEDPDILEKALGGPDTATRIQTVWQVKVQGTGNSPAECGADIGEPASTGRLSTRAIAPPASDDPCILSPTGGYRGIENRLYRVEIHDTGATTRFKWSRENASVVSAVTGIGGANKELTVTRIGRDAVLRFHIDDWVEVTDDLLELEGLPGKMARVVDVREATRTVVLDRAVSGFGTTDAEHRQRHTRVRRWDQRNGLDADGLLAVAPGTWVGLEDGVEVRFDPNAGTYHSGDHWSFAARTVDGSVEELTEAPPQGIHHFYCQLAAINPGTDPHDCRPLWPDCKCGCCCTIDVGNGTDSHGDFDDLVQAVQSLPQAREERLRFIFCLLPGIHRLRETVVIDQSFVTIRGCRELAPVIGPDNAPAFEVRGRSVRLEDLFVAAASGMPAILAQEAEDLQILDNQLRHPGQRFQTRTSEESGLIVLEQGTQGARILGNELTDGNSHGIAIAVGFHQDIVIAGNEIRGMEGCGIASIRSRASSDEQRRILREKLLRYLKQEGDAAPSVGGATTRYTSSYIPRLPRSADELRIEHNTITGCVGVDAQRRMLNLPYGGIVLLQVAHVQISDNRIQENGTSREAQEMIPGTTVRGERKVQVPVAGIYVRRCKGLIIRDNLVLDNGPSPDEQEPIPGLQGGILALDLSVELEKIDVMPGDQERFAPIQPDGWPAASVQNNLVVAPRGLALLLMGIGPMQVTGNRLTSRDIRGTVEEAPQLENLLGLYGAVVIFNAGWPAYVFRQALPLTFLSAKTGVSAEGISETPDLEPFTLGGKVNFSNNQVHLDLARGEIEAAFAAVGILTLDDLALQDNQTECTLFLDLLPIDVLALATTLRATGNGFTESLFGCLFSLFAIGLWMCTATSNQGTHCINAYAPSGPFPILISQDNASLFGPMVLARENCGGFTIPGLKGPNSDQA